MTTPNPRPDMQVTTAADGTLIYSWGDDVVVQTSPKSPLHIWIVQTA